MVINAPRFSAPLPLPPYMVWAQVGVAVGVAGGLGDSIPGFCNCALCLLVPRLRDCASANGIAQAERSASRINGDRRICALIEGLICFFISFALVVFEVE